MYKGKSKKFRDPIHGYIAIPEVLVREIIDTEMFQRLRYIEQTSMRSLYPAGRHDRFVHSLGVYCLGTRAFHYFMENTKRKLSKQKDRPKEEWWRRQEFLFGIACLVHDCAHAAFSHTLENFYVIKRVENVKGAAGEYLQLSKIDYLLIKRFEKVPSFENDFMIAPDGGVGAPHEKMSAYVAVTEFQKGIQNCANELLEKKERKLLDEDFELIARMITGCLYREKDTSEISLKNCIISMLNSSSIDVDGLDYVVRDAYMSGMDNFSIDYERLLQSFTVIPVETYKDLNLNSADITGIWQESTSFAVDKFRHGKISGRNVMQVKNYDYDKYYFENGRLPESESGIVTTPSDEVLHIELVRDARIEVAEACEVSGEFTGTIQKGWRIHDSRAERHQLGKNYEMRYILGYSKNSLSIIQSTVDARNHEFLWVYSHPKVLYCANYLQVEMIRLSAKYLCCMKNKSDFKTQKLSFSSCQGCSARKESDEDFVLNILGFETFLKYPEEDEVTEELNKFGYVFYRTCDDDLNALFKRIYVENMRRAGQKSEEIEACFGGYLKRKHQKTLWKSFAEYDKFRRNYADASNLIRLCEEVTAPSTLYKATYGRLSSDQSKIFDKYGLKNVVIIKSEVKTKQLNPQNTLIQFPDQVVRFCDVFDRSIRRDKMNKKIYYVFSDRETELSVDEMQRFLKDLDDR